MHDGIYLPDGSRWMVLSEWRSIGDKGVMHRATVRRIEDESSAHSAEIELDYFT